MKRRRKAAASFPFLMTNLMMSSWETIARRTMMMAQGKCSPAEYNRMVLEKASAAAESTMKMMSRGGMASVESLLAPWNRRATANAKRLRKK